MSDSLGQRAHWDEAFGERPDMFGAGPSESAQAAATLFAREGVNNILELGSGQGRDTLYFARCGFLVTAIDYSGSAIDAIAARTHEIGVADRVTAQRCDVRTRLPFADEAFDACYSHMLFCMALTMAEIEALGADVWRVLKPGGLQIYTVRHTGDGHYRTGIHRGEEMYEVGGFTVHFFDRANIAHLASGFTVLAVDEFQEGGLPRRLYRVTLRKDAESQTGGGGVR